MLDRKGGRKKDRKKDRGLLHCIAVTGKRDGQHKAR